MEIVKSKQETEYVLYIFDKDTKQQLFFKIGLPDFIAAKKVAANAGTDILKNLGYENLIPLPVFREQCGNALDLTTKHKLFVADCYDLHFEIFSYERIVV